MSTKPETTFSKNVNKYVNCYYMKNNNPYLGGIPDFWYSGSYTDLWAEYKYLSVSKPNTTVVPGLSPLQLRWIKGRITEGRNIWVIVGIKTGGVIYSEIDEMEFGIDPIEFMQRLVARQQLAGAINEYVNRTVHGADDSQLSLFSG